MRDVADVPVAEERVLVMVDRGVEGRRSSVESENGSGTNSTYVVSKVRRTVKWVTPKPMIKLARVDIL